MAEKQAGLDIVEFERLVRDALANLFDQAALATHPLAALTAQPSGTQQGRAEQLREMLVEAIEALRPSGEAEPCPNSLEWRPYLVLRGRYVDGASLAQLQERLALSARHLRREHSRAIQAVATLMWDVIFPDLAAPRPGPAEDLSAGNEFPVNLAALDIAELLQGIVATLKLRAEREGALLELASPIEGVKVLSDRVVLRQVLLTLLSSILDMRDQGPITISVERAENRVVLHIVFHLEDAELGPSPEEERDLSQLSYWCVRIGARFTLQIRATSGKGQIDLILPGVDNPLVLVVDDQESALRMFQRFLSHTDVRLVGVHDGAEALPLAQQLQPDLITLDLMMPKRDGWEVLQSLKADPATAHIPVVVCSVWEEPELAVSLGAAGFLAKPIKQKDLLEALTRLHLLGN
jgi:CheY-like chemotaxis protein